MANGQILHGGAGLPLYGKNGTLLYAAPISMNITVTISWASAQASENVKFLFMGRFDSLVSGYVGPGFDDSQTTTDGLTASWSGSENSGPYTVSLSYLGPKRLDGRYFDISIDWILYGEQSYDAPIVFTATDAKGNSKTLRMTVDQLLEMHVNFNANGTLKSLTTC